MTPSESEAWAPELRGWSVDILPWMRRLVPKLPHPFTYYEIGTYKGRSLAFMASEARRNGHDAQTRIIGVEAPILEPGSDAELLANIKRCAPWWDPVSVELLFARSLDAASRVPNWSADVVFIDATHSEQAVREDIGAWRPKVKSGGILAGHDYNSPPSKPSWPGVKEAVDAVLGQVNLDESVWWIRVP